MTVLLLADHDGTTLSQATARALTAARQLGEPVDILVAGADPADIAGQASAFEGVTSVLVARAPHYAGMPAEPIADLLVSLAADYRVIAAPATSRCRNILPRAAALLDMPQVSDVTQVINATTFERPIYAGNAIETVAVSHPRFALTIRTSAFAANPSGGKAPLSQVNPALDPQLATVVSREVSVVQGRPALDAARIVISGGRAFGSKDKFDAALTPLADDLGAAIGATRAAVDAGYAANDLQVGQTGKMVSPELYLAFGISGAIQHLAGIRDARIVVAVNSDPEAPIFQSADYGLVGDVFEVIPALREALRR
jgi:electron transfer flavoprotein alpha subunit